METLRVRLGAVLTWSAGGGWGGGAEGARADRMGSARWIVPWQDGLADRVSLQAARGAGLVLKEGADGD